MKRPFKFIIYKASDGTRWRCKRGGRIVADGSEAYSKPAGCRREVKNITDAMLPGRFVIEDETKFLPRH